MCYFRPDNLSICRTEKHLCVSVRTPLRFKQNASVFQVKHFGVSSKTLRCLLSNAKAFHPKRLGVLRTSGTTFPRNGSKPFFERRSVCDRTPKPLEAHAETFFPTLRVSSNPFCPKLLLTNRISIISKNSYDF